jgi:hypothetical protein
MFFDSCAIRTHSLQPNFNVVVVPGGRTVAPPLLVNQVRNEAPPFAGINVADEALVHEIGIISLTTTCIRCPYRCTALINN